MEYYSVIEKDILPCKIMGTELEDIVLSDKSPIKKGKFYIISLICGIRTREN